MSGVTYLFKGMQFWYNIGMDPIHLITFLLHIHFFLLPNFINNYHAYFTPTDIEIERWEIDDVSNLTATISVAVCRNFSTELLFRVFTTSGWLAGYFLERFNMTEFMLLVAMESSRVTIWI